MTTATVTATADTIFGPTPEAVEAYKKLVFATARGESTNPAERETIVEESWRLREHFDRDVATFQRRLEARRDLDERVPELEAKAARLKVEADKMRPERLGQKPLSSFKTLAELAADLEVLHYASEPGVMFSTQAEREWREAEMSVTSCQRSAVDLLHRTCDPEIDNQCVAVSRQIEGLKARIGERERLVQLPERIAELRQTIKELSAGRTPDHLAGSIGESRPRAAVIKEARARLRELLSLQAQHKPAVAEQKRDRAELARLEGEVVGLHQAKLTPENMRWSDID